MKKIIFILITALFSGGCFSQFEKEISNYFEHKIEIKLFGGSNVVLNLKNHCLNVNKNADSLDFGLIGLLESSDFSDLKLDSILINLGRKNSLKKELDSCLYKKISKIGKCNKRSVSELSIRMSNILKINNVGYFFVKIVSSSEQCFIAFKYYYDSKTIFSEIVLLAD